jgi:hypothetical protein
MGTGGSWAGFFSSLRRFPNFVWKQRSPSVSPSEQIFVLEARRLSLQETPRDLGLGSARGHGTAASCARGCEEKKTC